jgi:hypothetical protein
VTTEHVPLVNIGAALAAEGHCQLSANLSCTYRIRSPRPGLSRTVVVSRAFVATLLQGPPPGDPTRRRDGAGSPRSAGARPASGRTPM